MSPLPPFEHGSFSTARAAKPAKPANPLAKVSDFSSPRDISPGARPATPIGDSIDSIFRTVTRAGIRLRLEELPDGAWTFIARPASEVTSELREALTQHGAEVLAELIKNNLCRAPGCQDETFIYSLDGDQEAVTLCERHHRHCAAPGCDRAATFTSTRSGLLYCRLDHLDESEVTR